MKKLIVLFVLVSCAELNAQDEVSLTVQVDEVRKLEGKVMIAVYDKEELFLEDEVVGGTVDALGSSVTYSFKGLRKGTYAISIFHDLNGNGKLDTNFVGIPTEPYAFSNNAKGMFGPPSFEECKFEFVESSQKVTISL